MRDDRLEIEVREGKAAPESDVVAAIASLLLARARRLLGDGERSSEDRRTQTTDTKAKT